VSDAAVKQMAKWRKSIAQFALDNFHFTPDPWQIDVFAAWDHGDQRIAMQACKGPGKTALLAVLVWHFIATRPHSKIAATSVSGANLADGLWTELAKWQKLSAFLQAEFDWQKTRIVHKQEPETWWASARTWSQSASPEKQADTLAGLHADYILFVLDETGAMPDAVMVAAEAALSSGIECRIVQAGNPTQCEGPLWRACNKDRHQWTVINVTGDPDDPKRSPRIDAKWAQQQIDSYGRDNPWVMANVFGKFPPSSPLSFIPMSLVEAAAAREPMSIISDPMVLGVDVARFGDDEQVIVPRKGRDARTVDWGFFRNLDTMQLASRVIEKRNALRADAVFVDGGGVGGGVVDRMRQLRFDVHDVQFGAKADRSPMPGVEAMRCANKVAEMWVSMREWLKTGAIPNDPVLHAQLTGRRYAYVTISGRDCIALEPKEEMKKRGLASPDRADGLALTFAYPVMPSAFSGGVPGDRRGPSVVSEYDPLASE
jgi:phage terminase large subunit